MIVRELPLCLSCKLEVKEKIKLEEHTFTEPRVKKMLSLVNFLLQNRRFAIGVVYMKVF